MKKIISNAQPKDFIAILAIVGGFVLMYKGIDSVVAGIMIAIISYYFGRRLDLLDKKINK